MFDILSLIKNNTNKTYHKNLKNFLFDYFHDFDNYKYYDTKLDLLKNITNKILKILLIKSIFSFNIDNILYILNLLFKKNYTNNNKSLTKIKEFIISNDIDHFLNKFNQHFTFSDIKKNLEIKFEFNFNERMNLLFIKNNIKKKFFTNKIPRNEFLIRLKNINYFLKNKKYLSNNLKNNTYQFLVNNKKEDLVRVISNSVFKKFINNYIFENLLILKNNFLITFIFILFLRNMIYQLNLI